MSDRVSLREHLEMVSRLNDQRYAEVAVEREKALGIKEQADERALVLAREIQAYRDEKANGLQAQIERERGGFPTRLELVAAVEKLEAAMKPLGEFVASQQGRSAGSLDWRTILLALIAVVAIFVAPHIH